MHPGETMVHPDCPLFFQLWWPVSGRETLPPWALRYPSAAMMRWRNCRVRNTAWTAIG